MAIEPQRLAYDASRGRLYVTINGAATLYPNTIAVVDPKSATVTTSIPVGSDPGVLALSDDSSTLWVGLDGSFSLRKVTLTGATPVVGPMRMLPPEMRSAAVYAQALVPQSDSPLAVAALIGASPGHLAIYDDGVRRANPNETLVYPSTIFKGPPGMFFGTGSVGSSETLFWMRVLPAGIAQATFSGVLDGGVGGNNLYKDGRVYVGGKVIDVSNPATPSVVGTLPFRGVIAAHSSPNRLVMLSPPPIDVWRGQWELRLIDTATLTQRGSVKVPNSLLGADIVPDTVFDVAYLGGDGLALLASTITAAPRLVILHAPMLANDGVDPNPGAGGQGGGTGGASGTGGAGGMPGALCDGCTLHRLDVPGFRMIYDAPHARLYVVNTYDAPHDKNSLVSVDAAKEVVLATLPIDPAPRQLALSDDGATLWVGFDETNAIRKFGVVTTPPVAGPAYPLPAWGTNPVTGAARAYDLVALPGTTHSIAACISGSIGSRILILDDGVPRSTIDESRLSISKIVAGPAGTLFGYDGMTSAYTFSSYTVTAAGVTLLSARQGLMGVFQNDFLYHQGRVYANWGEVIDVADPAKPFRAGKFAIKGLGGLITPRSSTRMLLLSEGVNSTALQLQILNTETFTTVATLSLGLNIGSGILSAGDLVYLGGDAVAFLNLRRELVILRSPMIATPP